MNWTDTKVKLYDEDGGINYDLTDGDKATLIAMLSPSGLLDALKEAKGCGCCVNTVVLDVRSEIFERVYNILEDCQ